MKESHCDIETLEEVQETVASYRAGINSVHILKTVEPYFSDVWNEVKTAELRDSSDREFRVGDILVLRQWECYTPTYDWGLYGIICRVTHILTPDQINQLASGEELVLDTKTGYRVAKPMSMLSFQLLDKFKLRDIAIDLEFPQS